MYIFLNSNNIPGDDIRANMYNMTFYVDLVETKVSDVVKNLKNVNSLE